MDKLIQPNRATCCSIAPETEQDREHASSVLRNIDTNCGYLFDIIPIIRRHLISLSSRDHSQKVWTSKSIDIIDYSALIIVRDRLNGPHPFSADGRRDTALEELLN